MKGMHRTFSVPFKPNEIIHMTKAARVASPAIPEEAVQSTHGARARLPRSGVLRAAGATALAYYLAAELGATLADSSTSVSMLWAPNAILLAALVLAKRSDWWLYLTLVFVAHLVAQMSHANVSIAQTSIHYVVSISTALIGALGLSALAPDSKRFDRLRSLLVFIAFGAILAPVSTGILTASLFVAFAGSDVMWITAYSQALSNAVAILTVVPLIVHAADWMHSGGRSIVPLRAAEAFLLTVTLATAGILVFASPPLTPADSVAILYAPLPMLLWATVRFGVVGTCGSILLLGTLAMWGGANGTGPFSAQIPARATLSVDLYLVVACIPLLTLAAALGERNALASENRLARERFRALFDNNLTPTAIWRRGGDIVDANDAFLRLAGFDRSEVEDGRLGTRTLGLDSRPASGERELVLRGGRQIPVSIKSFPFPGTDDEGVLCAFDLSPVRDAEESRRQGDLLHAAVLSSVHDQIVVLDAAGTIIGVNESWRRFVECAAIQPFETARIGSHYLDACARAAANGDAMAADLLAAARDVLDGMSAGRRMEFSIDTADGLLWFEICIEPLRRADGGAVIIRTDITAQKQATLEVGEQRQQMALLGRAAVLGELSGAFAHELSQPLTSILGNAEAALQLLTRNPPSLAEVPDMLRDIIHDDVRASEVLQRLRSMLARGEIQRQPVDLNQVVRDVLELGRSDLITRGVSVALQLDPNALPVLADPVQLQQVVLNLVVNACEAMSGMPTGDRRLTLATRLTDGAIECAVSDRGHGIAEGDLERIFQPFVTTKNQGLGLGLAISRSIVEAHGGRLWAERGADGGAIFRFTARVDA
jgi:signal transduction histidine kinase/integral membrane sensor domain MASE1